MPNKFTPLYLFKFWIWSAYLQYFSIQSRLKLAFILPGAQIGPQQVPTGQNDMMFISLDTVAMVSTLTFRMNRKFFKYLFYIIWTP